MLSRATRFGPGTALVVAVTCGLVTAYGVANLRAALPSLSTTEVWVTALVVSGCVGVVTLFPQRWWSVLPACLVLLWTGAQVNPVVFGLGDLRASGAAGAARQIGAAARANGTSVASDDPFVSALLVANGAPSITGWQITGPRQELWRVLDPDGSDEELWNRGASYLRMTFDGAPGTEPVIANPNPDIIQVSLDPCAIPAELDVRTLIAEQQARRALPDPGTHLRLERQAPTRLLGRRCPVVGAPHHARGDPDRRAARACPRHPMGCSPGSHASSSSAAPR